MRSWAARARTEIQKVGNTATAITDETRITSVSSVPSDAIFEFPKCVSSVSSVGVAGILEIDGLSADLLAVAMKVCDRHGDGPEAREQMRRECVDLPPHLQRDLLAHFLATS